MKSEEEEVIIKCERKKIFFKEGNSIRKGKKELMCKFINKRTGEVMRDEEKAMSKWR